MFRVPRATDETVSSECQALSDSGHSQRQLWSKKLKVMVSEGMRPVWLVHHVSPGRSHDLIPYGTVSSTFSAGVL